MGSLRAVPVLALLFIAAVSAQTTPFNITTLLAQFPDFSELNRLLSATNVSEEINSRQSLTLLALSNSVLSGFQTTLDVGDVLRYHVLLQFFSIDDLQALPENATGVTTLLQTTGRVQENAGELNIYNTPAGVVFGPTVLGSTSNASLVTNISRVNYDISVVQIDRVLIPAPLAPASEPTTAPASAPATSAPAPSSGTTPASAPAPASATVPAPATIPASGPAPASATTPASAPAPVAKPPAKPPVTPVEPPVTESAPAPEGSSPGGNGAGVIKGGIITVFASLVTVLFM
ncbi:hypothetical protein R1sor_021639 [Riccia sorocarpa]|uniref:FAS1 domain-containing protein n=1 Tax=Riccia sorocarpa TaxID=122646 RepID=A0ABD3GID3_9MARC